MTEQYQEGGGPAYAVQAFMVSGRLRGTLGGVWQVEPMQRWGSRMGDGRDFSAWAGYSDGFEDGANIMAKKLEHLLFDRIHDTEKLFPQFFCSFLIFNFKVKAACILSACSTLYLKYISIIYIPEFRI